MMIFNHVLVKRKGTQACIVYLNSGLNAKAESSPEKTNELLQYKYFIAICYCFWVLTSLRTGFR